MHFKKGEVKHFKNIFCSNSRRLINVLEVQRCSYPYSDFPIVDKTLL